MKLKSLLLGLILSATAGAYDKRDLYGVWELNEFYYEAADGARTEYCEGAFGKIMYFPKNMAVGINCKSDKKLFYSGPVVYDELENEVYHKPKNYSDVSLHQYFRRQVSMENENQLTLKGAMANGRTVVVTWTRVEKFEKNSDELYGVYDLVGSENDVGQGQPVPFCNGFHGSIAFTPGGHTYVSINCGQKIEGQIEPAQLFDRMYFYHGTFTVQGNIVAQLPQNASVLDHIGHIANREASMKGDILTLAGTNGARFIAKWRKVWGFNALKK